MPRLKFKAPTGTDILNIGTEAFTTDRDGIVEIPEELAGQMTAVDGFVLVTAPAPALTAGTAEVAGQPGASFSWGGETFTVGDDGRTIVPASALTDIAAHGFIAVRVAAPVAVPTGGRPGDAPMGFAVLKAAPGASCSWNGHNFSADDSGHMIVPADAVAELAAHGFLPAPTEAPAEPEAVAAVEAQPEQPVEQPATIDEPVVAEQPAEPVEAQPEQSAAE